MSSICSINVYPGNVTLSVGEWYYGLNAVVIPSSQQNQIHWYSSNPAVATVGYSTGYIFPIQNGSATIYACSNNDSSIWDSCFVTVQSNVNIECISLDRSEVTLEKGDCTTLHASIYPPNATNKSLRWYANHSNVSVENGVVRGLSKGTAIVTARAMDIGSASATCTVHVTEHVLVNSISIHRSYLNMEVGESQTLYATICPSNATDKTVVWETTNESIATVNPNNGTVTAVGPGTVTISANAIDGSNAVGVCTITVRQAVEVQSISILPPCCPIVVGDNFFLETIIRPSYATNQYLTWHSSNPDVISVGTYTGYVAAYSRGEAIITATSYDGSVSGRIKLTVSKERVLLIRENDYVKVVFSNNLAPWKCIGIDFESLDPISENHCILRSRLSDNETNDYSEEQLAFLYLIDPMGVSQYLKEYSSHHRCYLSDDFYTREYQILQLKDSVYNLIFGEKPKYYRIIEGENGNEYLVEVHPYVTMTMTQRRSVFSSAEAIFGFHTLFGKSFPQALLEELFGLITSALGVLSTYGEKFDGCDAPFDALEKTKILFFDKSFSDAGQNAVSGIVDECVNNYKKQLKELGVPVPKVPFKYRLFNWSGILLQFIYDVGMNYFESLQVPDFSGVQICNHLDNNTIYIPLISTGNQTFTMKNTADLIRQFNRCF